MSFDLNSGQAGVIATVAVGVPAIVVAIIAPIMWKRGRIELTQGAPIPLKSEIGIQEIEIKVFNTNEEVHGQVYVTTCTFRNTGGRDLTRDDFIRPIEIKRPDGFWLISGKIDCNDGIGASGNLGRDAYFLNWDILKPNEKIVVSLILSEKSFEHESAPIPENLACEPRLRDVKVGSRFIDNFVQGTQEQRLQIIAGTGVLVGLVYFELAHYLAKFILHLQGH